MKDSKMKVADVIPSRFTVSRNVHLMAEQYRKIFTELMMEPLKTNAFTLSPDLWVDQFKKITYLGVTGTFIDSEGKYRTITLCCCEFTEKEKTAVNIEKVNLSFYFDLGNKIIACICLFLKVLKSHLLPYGITSLHDVNWVCDRGG